MLKKYFLLLLCLVTLLSSALCLAEYDVQTHVVKFDKGKFSKIFNNAVIRGDREHYIFSAKAGQHLKVALSSVENNAEFQIYLPGYKILPKDEDGISSVSGNVFSKDNKIVENNNEKASLTHLNTTLNISGDYLIEVGGTRGNADYKLEIAIQ